MLQSGQAGNAALIDVLVSAYYLPVYRLALACLENPHLAERAAVEVFSTALLNVYRYRSEVGVRAWLFGHALETFNAWQRRMKLQGFLTSGQLMARRSPNNSASTPRNKTDAHLWRAVDSLSNIHRLPILLHSLLGWSDAEINDLLPDSGTQVQARRELTWAAGDLNLAGQDLQASLSDSLQFRWPAPDLSRQDLEQIMAAILDQAGMQAARRRRFTSLNEILLVGVAVLFAAGLFWGYNRLFPEPEPAPIARVPSTAAPAALASITPSPAATRTSRPASTPTPAPTLFPSGVFYYVRPVDDIPSIARRFRIPVAELLSLNRLPVDAVVEVGQALLIPSDRLPTSTPAIATPVIPPTSLPALSAGSSPEAILERSRMFGGVWSTLWFDLDLVLYGPTAYIGPPLEFRMQGWIGQDQVLVLTGPASQGPYHVLMTNAQSETIYFARPGMDRPWFIGPGRYEERSFVESLLPFQWIFEQAFSPVFSALDRTQPQIRVLGSEQVSGREALIVEQSGAKDSIKFLLWLDKLTGFPLRKQRLAQGQPEALFSESRINAIAYNVDFPQELFDPRLPWRGGYAQDFTGRPFPAAHQPTPWARIAQPTPLPARPAPPDFNPAQSKLVFQAPRQAFNFFDLPANVTPTFMDLYGDNFFLGRVEFPIPVFTICDRSPDGRRIAFASQSMYSDLEYYSTQPPLLRWIDLAGPDQVLTPSNAVEAYEFAFAPDSRLLAFFGKEAQAGERGLYLLDTGDGTYQRILQAFVVHSLVWSPDGEHLAMLLRENSTQGTEAIVVMNIGTRGTIYRTTYFPGRPIPTAIPLPDWLASMWGTEFPAEMGDLDACSKPPGK